MVDEDGRIIGRTSVMEKGAVSSPLKPLADGESARWNGSSWEYRFRPVKRGAAPQPSLRDEILMLTGPLYHLIRPVSAGKSFARSPDDRTAVLMPCFGKAAYVTDAVQSCLSQTQRPDEIVVLLMDSRSISLKESLESLDPSVKCHESGRLDAVQARELLLSLTEADWILFLDADDLLCRGFIEAVSRHECAVCYGRMERLFPDGRTERAGLCGGTPGNHPVNAMGQNLTCLMHRDVLSVMRLDGSLAEGGEDIDFFLRIMEEKRFLLEVEPEAAWLYRQEVDGQLTSRSAFWESFFRMLAKHSSFLADELEAVPEQIPGKDMCVWLLRNFTRRNLHVFSRGCSSCSDSYAAVLRDIEASFCIEAAGLLEESRSRSPLGTYSSEGFVFEGCSPDEEILDRIQGREFDVLFLDGEERAENALDAVFRPLSFIASRKAAEDAAQQNFTESLDKALYMLRKYSCFSLSRRQKEPLFARESMPEELFRRLCSMKELPAASREILSLFRERISASYSSCLPPLQKASFILSKKCNLSCPYCSERLWVQPPLSDGEIYEKFDRALSRLEEMACGRLCPQLLGGEPSLWSGWLTEKIISRMKGYRQVVIFTNGTDRSSAFFRQPNFSFYTHITDWKGRSMDDYTAENNELFNICVLHNEFDEVEEFMRTVRTDRQKRRIYFQPCGSDNPEWNCTAEDIVRLSALLDRYRIVNTLSSYADMLRKHGEEHVRRECRAGRGVWNIDCTTMMISSCCSMRSPVPLEAFSPASRPDCSGCLNWGNTNV